MLTIEIEARPTRQLDRIPAKQRDRLLDKIEALAADPMGRHTWAKALTGRPGLRVRQGDYRAIVHIDHQAGTLTVVEVGHRKAMYR